MEKLTEQEQKKYLSRWIKAIVRNKKTTNLSIKRHIIKHAKGIFRKDPKLWAASMRNLVEIYENLHGINPKTATQIERLEEKYKKNRNRYTAPPN